MNPISLEVYIKPTPKQSVKFNKATGSFYKPSKITEAEHRILMTFLEKYGTKRLPYFQRGVPLQLKVKYILERPKTVKRGYPTVRPDFDNLTKLVCDSLEKYAYDNDAQIVRAVIEKEYGDAPILLIEISPLT